MARFFDTLLHRSVLDENEARLVEMLASPGTREHAASAIDKVLAEISPHEPPSEPALASMAEALFGDAMDDEVRLAFWRALAARFPGHAYIRACLGHALLSAGHDQEGLEALLGALDTAPLLVHDFDDAAPMARSLGREPWLRWQLAELRAAIAAAEQSMAGDDPDPDDPDDPDDLESDLDIRERYSELLEEYQGDAHATAALRELGKRIGELEDAGILPQVLMRRGDWRSK